MHIMITQGLVRFDLETGFFSHLVCFFVTASIVWMILRDDH